MNAPTPLAQKLKPLAAAAGERRLGALLVEAGKITVEDAERVLRAQRELGLLFGEAAIQLGLVSEADVRQVLSRQFDYPYLAPGESAISEEVIAAYAPFSKRVDALRALRTQLKLRWFDAQAGRPLAVMSPDRGDGRTWLAANLAVVFSQLGERTLLIDADLRNPRQHRLFGVPHATGFSSVLAGRGDLTAIQRIPGLVDLSVLPAGPLPPNPVELIDRAVFSRLLEQLARDYGVILIDTAAGLGNADAQAVAIRSRAAMLVAHQHRTRIAGMRALMAALHTTELVGTVMNSH